ncbi:MAG: hypothetical protein A2W72_24920 [Burkholderiales bacterium RIFCSPLOWO2_12_67_14]|nr:MAG: hypothetical protein A3I64_15795 [Burkholderiales bacterium RIFCSPLOWO2_02_FULL_67_64]OGB45985.1 MAG: hypothetical protein A3E51_08285 [Burkholderiales bacterium RIFCSPHIGHO2_12_FULL_67_38]OGB50026.1 MAG: hypothetical protein A2W72_24920 [Burkholderiales bacterium RIFCSPLOWO2_12_67_14]
MKKSLLLRLPDIVAHGHRQASHFLDGLDDRQRIAWHPRHRALSAHGAAPPPENPTRDHLVCGDDLGVLAALLAGHANLPRLRGRVNLICFNPGPGAPAAPASNAAQTDKERLTAFALRLLLMRALLADTGFICVRLAQDPACCARLVVDTVFGSENSAQDILWHTPPSPRMASAARRHGLVHVYAKHRRRVEPALPGPAAPWGRSSSPAEALLRHLLAVSTAPGDTVVAFNAGAEIAAVAAPSARQWVITAPDAPACDALHQHLSAQGARPFLRQTLPALG